MVGHPGTKGFEMFSVEKLLVKPQGIWALPDQLGCKILASWTVGGRVDRMERVHGGLRECF